jgi:hypothetical protein
MKLQLYANIGNALARDYGIEGESKDAVIETLEDKGLQTALLARIVLGIDELVRVTELLHLERINDFNNVHCKAITDAVKMARAIVDGIRSHGISVSDAMEEMLYSRARTYDGHPGIYETLKRRIMLPYRCYTTRKEVLSYIARKPHKSSKLREERDTIDAALRKKKKTFARPV